MAEEKAKDIWDKLSAITPLVLGLAVTGVGTVFTQVYNEHQLQLNKIEALDKLRPLLNSSKPEDRAFGYAAFSSLGYEKVAIQLIAFNKDESGRPLLQAVQQQSTSPEVRTQATSALDALDRARKVVNVAEYGTEDPKSLLQKPEVANNPQFAKEIQNAIDSSGIFEAWAQNAEKQLGSSSPLLLSILLDTVENLGMRDANLWLGQASQSTSPPLDSPAKQKAWCNQYLDLRTQFIKDHSFPPEITSAFARRIQMYRDQVKQDNWDLNVIPQRPNAPATQ